MKKILAFSVFGLALLSAVTAVAQGSGYSSGKFGLSGGNNTWPGGVATSHNGIPAVSLSTTCAGTVTPASSFGFYTVTVTGAGCVIAFPSSVVAGESANFLITEGASNVASFASGYNGWIGGAPFVGTASAVNHVTCKFTGLTSPAPTTVCGPGGAQAGLVAPPPASKAFLQAVVGANQAGAGTSTTIPMSLLAAGQTIVCAMSTGADIVTGISDAANSYTLLQTMTQDFTVLKLYGKASLTGSPGTTITAASSSGTDRQLGCEIWSGAPAIVTSAQNSQGTPGSGANQITVGPFTIISGDALVGFNTNDCGATSTAGTGFIVDDSSAESFRLSIEHNSSPSSGSQNVTYTNANGGVGCTTKSVGIQLR